MQRRPSRPTGFGCSMRLGRSSFCVQSCVPLLHEWVALCGLGCERDLSGTGIALVDGALRWRIRSPGPRDRRPADPASGRRTSWTCDPDAGLLSFGSVMFSLNMVQLRSALGPSESLTPFGLLRILKCGYLSPVSEHSAPGGLQAVPPGAEPLRPLRALRCIVIRPGSWVAPCLRPASEPGTRPS